MITIKKYTESDFKTWNIFVASAKNATFLFHRNFMEYHKNRFKDYSLLCFKNDKLIAVFPANIVKKIVYSHQGLTYGGLLITAQLKFENYIVILQEMLKYLNKNNIKKLIIKPIPSFYTTTPSEELAYLQQVLQAKLLTVNISSTINLSEEIIFSRSRKNGIKRAIKNKLEIREETSFNRFWNELLVPNLQKKHQVKPVHSLDEINLLKQKFPKNIRQFNVYKNDEIVAGTVIFETKNIAHSQYLSGNETKNENGSLDFLHQYLIHEVYKNKNYFDFGTSTENNGKYINKGLLYWKEGFGARATTCKTYEILTANFVNLEQLFI